MSSSNQNCVFCQIVDGRLPASFVYRDDLVSVFMDIHPINPGHLLIVPNQHTESVIGVAPLTAARMFQVAQLMVKTLRETPNLPVRFEAANIFLSEGEAAGQEVPHAHLHIAPRFKGDGHRMGFSGTDADAGDRSRLDLIAKKLHEGLLQSKKVGAATNSKVRFAKPTDVHTWAEMRDLLWPGSTLHAHVQDAEALLQRSDIAVFIVEHANELAGFAEVSIRAYANGCDTAPVAFLEGIFISFAYRRRGFAQLLVAAVHEWARQRGFQEVGSDVDLENFQSIAAHQAWGFEKTEQVQYLRLKI